MPYRVEAIGNDGLLYSLTLNKVAEAVLNTNGWCFPFISQTIALDYEGLTNYRAKARQFTYDISNGNLTNAADLGEVTNVVVSSHSFTDIGSDAIYSWTTFAALSNPDIKDKPSDVKITSDSSGSTRLRETKFFYHGSDGDLTNQQVWLDTAGQFFTVSTLTYDQYGNVKTSADAANITTTNTYDSTYQTFPITKITATFTNQFTNDLRSGLLISATDAKGLVSSNFYDLFFRLKETDISTNAYGPPTLWRSRFDYNLGGISNGISYNYVHERQFDAVDLTNGHETYAYTDGLGRTAQGSLGFVVRPIQRGLHAVRLFRWLTAEERKQLILQRQTHQLLRQQPPIMIQTR